LFEGAGGVLLVEPSYKLLTASAKTSAYAKTLEKAIDEARAILKSKKPTAEEMAKRARSNKANEIAKIRNQGRNTR
jgi:F0F1-type ATP synthase membrane subunit b/b'